MKVVQSTSWTIIMQNNLIEVFSHEVSHFLVETYQFFCGGSCTERFVSDNDEEIWQDVVTLRRSKLSHI